MDWGILDRHAGENRFLREEIVYASKVLVWYCTAKYYFIYKVLKDRKQY